MTAGFNLYQALPSDAALVASFGDRKLDIPVLTITGHHSVGDHLATVLNWHSTKLESVIAEDSGHFVAEEEPQFFCDQLARFLTASQKQGPHQSQH